MANAPALRASVETGDDKVHIVTWPREQLRLCASVCEPICLDSKYRVDVRVFGARVADFVIRGRTTVMNCKEAKADSTVEAVHVREAA